MRCVPPPRVIGDLAELGRVPLPRPPQGVVARARVEAARPAAAPWRRMRQRLYPSVDLLLPARSALQLVHDGIVHVLCRGEVVVLGISLVPLGKRVRSSTSSRGPLLVVCMLGCWNRTLWWWKDRGRRRRVRLCRRWWVRRDVSERRARRRSPSCAVHV
jgi:hypothetical protein